MRNVTLHQCSSGSTTTPPNCGVVSPCSIRVLPIYTPHGIPHSRHARRSGVRTKNCNSTPRCCSNPAPPSSIRVSRGVLYPTPPSTRHDSGTHHGRDRQSHATVCPPYRRARPRVPGHLARPLRRPAAVGVGVARPGRRRLHTPRARPLLQDHRWLRRLLASGRILARAARARAWVSGDAPYPIRGGVSRRRSAQPPAG